MRYPFWLIIVPLLGCSLPEHAPPSAEFLVADMSSTYWVRSGPHRISVRSSPLILASVDNRFYEVYVDEVTRSYEDAFFTGEPVYSRDLITGKRQLLLQESRVAAWEKAYLSANPAAKLLDPDEEGSEDVSVVAAAEVDILGVLGPYVLYDRRVTLERGDFQQADSSRGALDVRSGTTVALDALVRDTAILGSGAVREKNLVRWRHAGYEVVARWDEERGESAITLRDLRGHEWQLGYTASRLPRIFWLDEPRVDGKLRSALADAFNEASADDGETQLVERRDAVEPRLVAWGR
jgi:hypothetical protein